MREAGRLSTSCYPLSLPLSPSRTGDDESQASSVAAALPFCYNKHPAPVRPPSNPPDEMQPCVRRDLSLPLEHGKGGLASEQWSMTPKTE